MPGQWLRPMPHSTMCKQSCMMHNLICCACLCSFVSMGIFSVQIVSLSTSQTYLKAVVCMQSICRLMANMQLWSCLKLMFCFVCDVASVFEMLRRQTLTGVMAFESGCTHPHPPCPPPASPPSFTIPIACPHPSPLMCTSAFLAILVQVQ